MPMRLLSRLFPASRTAQNASRIPGRRRPKARGLATPVAARALSLAAESLERRAMLAVTATLSDGDLLISYNAAGDSVADISSDGTNYTVSGTGLAAKTFTISDVTGVISVADKASVFGQQFKVNAGTPLANALQVNANVESTSLLGGITTAVAGDVLIGSAAISLANDISTAATSGNIDFAGPVTLAKNTIINANGGNIAFDSTVDGGYTLKVNSTGATTFGGVVGGTEPLASLTTDAGGTVSLVNVTTTGAQTYNDDTVTLNGTYTTTDSAFTVDKVTKLAGNTTVSTGAGAGDITFKGTLDGAKTLGLTAGTGNVTFTGLVGDTTALGAITVNSATNVTANGIRAASLTQVAGAGTTTLNGGVFTSAPALTEALRTSDTAGISLKGTNLTVNGAMKTVNTGTVKLDQEGTIVIAEAGDISADGKVSVKAIGGITTAGDVTTTDDDVDFESKVTLSGNVAMNTGSGDGNITFVGTLDGAKRATLAAGTGSIFFKAAVGSTTPLAGLTLTSAASTTASSTVKLAKAADSAQDGFTIAAGVNNVTMTASGSSVAGFARDGISFLGGSTNSFLSGFTVSGNGSNGMNFAAGSYTGTTLTANTIRDNGDKTAHVGDGILVRGSNLMIGWDATPETAAAVQNTITGNALNGIQISGNAATGNTILSNTIFLNGYVANGLVVGEGISLTDQGNDNRPAPRILDVVRDNEDAGSPVVHVQFIVDAAGSYLVQFFSNTGDNDTVTESMDDDRGLFPADVNGFEGRTFVGESPLSTIATAGVGKPVIQPVGGSQVVTGNSLQTITIPASLLAAGSWLTATATKLAGTAPLATSGFSSGVQVSAAPVLAVGSDGPAVWVPHYTYQALSGNVLRLGGLTVTEVNRLVAMRGRQIFVSGNGRSEVATATVASVRRIGGRAVNMVLRNITSPEGSLAGTAGRLEPGPLTLPTARLYDAATGEVVLDVGAEAIAASLEAAGVTPGAAAAFTSRFQGGLRVASGDVNGDGFAELLTAPGVSPAIPAATFGTATRIITIYNGDKAAGWQSVSLDVSGAFPGYSGGFQVTLGDVLPEVPGSGSGVLELIVAGTNKVAVYELTVPGRGAAPVIAATPAAVWTVGPRFRITGLTVGDFSAAASDEVVVATAAPAGTFVRTFTLADGGFTTQSSFWAWSYVEGDPQRRLRDVFANGASLAVGDIDGTIDGKPELVLAAGAQGLANFRVLANDLVATGSQAAINQALSMGRGFTQRSRPQFTTVNGRQVWQPAGGPDYFVGVPRLTNAVARGINAPLSVAVVNARGTTAAGQVFAALGPQNATSNMVRRLAWSRLEASWSGTDAFQAQPAGRTRFPLGGGVLLG